MTNGLVRSACLALSLVLPAVSFAEDVAYQLADGGGSSGCDLGDVGCDCCRRGGFWFAGVETTMLQTTVRSGGIITASFSDTTAPGVSTNAFVDGDGLEKFTFAPRIWIGRQLTEKWGIVGRYWDVTAESTHEPDGNPNIPNTGTNFATIFQTDIARLYTADLELIRSFDPWGWKIDATAGVRVGHVNASSDFLAFGVFTTGNFINLTLQNGFRFDGIGGTGSLLGRYQIGNSPLSFVIGGRYSFLTGQTTSFGRSDGTVASSPSSPLVGAATVTRADASAHAYIAEFQTGLQVDHQLAYLPASVFFRTMFEYQNWIVDAPPTGGAGFGGTIGELTTNSFASAGIGRANLVGLSVAVGVNW